MIKRVLLLCCVVICVLFTACKDKITALQLNQELTCINDSLAYFGNTWGEEFKQAYSTSDFSGLYPIRTNMERYVNQNIDKVMGMKDVGGSKAFREQELAYLQFEKEIIGNHFARFEFFNDLTPPAEMAKAYNDLMAASQKEQAILQDLHVKVMEYAERNGL